MNAPKVKVKYCSSPRPKEKGAIPSFAVVASMSEFSFQMIATEGRHQFFFKEKEDALSEANVIMEAGFKAIGIIEWSEKGCQLCATFVAPGEFELPAVDAPTGDYSDGASW